MYIGDWGRIKFSNVFHEEEVIQMNGELEAVNDALPQITSRFQRHFFQDAFRSLTYPQNPAFSDRPPFQSYLRLDFSPPRMHSNFGPSFHKFDTGGGLAPHAGFHPLHLSERRPWDSQAAEQVPSYWILEWQFQRFKDNSPLKYPLVDDDAATFC